MKKRGCILCGEPTEFDFHNFCDRCFNLSIEEIEERFLKKTTFDVREDQKQPGATEDPCEFCQPKTFYHRSKEFVKRLFGGKSESRKEVKMDQRIFYCVTFDDGDGEDSVEFTLEPYFSQLPLKKQVKLAKKAIMVLQVFCSEIGAKGLAKATVHRN